MGGTGGGEALGGSGMRLEPLRDGNPKPLFLAVYLFSVGALAALVLVVPEELRLFLFGLLLVEIPLTGALLYWIAGFPERLHYGLGGDLLVVHEPLGRHEVWRADVLQALPVRYRLPLFYKGQGTSLPGCHTRKGVPLARFNPEPYPPGLPRDIPVEAYVGAREGWGVLLLLKGRALLLNPEDPRPLLGWVGGGG